MKSNSPKNSTLISEMNNLPCTFEFESIVPEPKKINIIEKSESSMTSSKIIK